MADPDPEFEWVEADEWESYEISRHGDEVFFVLSDRNGEAYVLGLSPEDAVTLGLQLAQAGQEPMEEES